MNPMNFIPKQKYYGFCWNQEFIPLKQKHFEIMAKPLSNTGNP